MEKERKIPKAVPAPILFPDEAIRLVTDLCFLPKEEVDRNTVFGQYGEALIFGTSHPTSHAQIIREFVKMCDSGYRPEKVYITGGETVPGTVESEAIFALIDDYRYRHTRFFNIEFVLERNSRDTLQNVECAITLGLGGNTGIMFVAKSGHCGRAKLTLSRFFPRKDIQAWGYDAILSDGIPPVSRDAWFQNPVVRDLVWGEFCRIELYGGQGNIAYPNEIRHKVECVRALTRT